jgi:hypothetical protein
LLLWPRGQSYYQRNDWAGRIRSQDGAWVLDSPVNNATAHYLHNMLFLLGDSMETSAVPASLEAELYRANAIENYDTAALRIVTEAGTPLLFLTTHAVVEQRGPVMEYEFEDAVVEFNDDDYQFRVRFHNGSMESYGNPADTEYNKLWQTVEAARSGGAVVCGVGTAVPHLQCVLGAQETPIVDFPKEFVKVKEAANDRTIWVEGLFETFLSCYQSGRLPSETGTVPWAISATKVDQFPVVR